MSLFPNIEPFDSHFLQVSGLHTVYVEEAGNPGLQTDATVVEGLLPHLPRDDRRG